MERAGRFRAGPAILAILAVCGPLACGGAQRSGGPGQTPTSGSGAPGAVLMTVDGKAVEFQGVIATGIGQHVIEVELASHPLVCNHPAEQHAAGDPDKHVVLTLAPILHPDGKSEWHIISTFFDDASRLDDGGAASTDGSVDSGLDVALPALSLQGGGEPASHLAFAGGRIHAQGCRNAPLFVFSGEDKTPPTARPQRELQFSVAGASQSIDSALLIRGKDASQLVLTTGEQSCTASTDTPDLSYTLVLDAQGRPTGAWLAGAVFDQQRTQTFDAGSAAPKVVVGQANSGQIAVRVDGAYDAPGLRREARRQRPRAGVRPSLTRRRQRLWSASTDARWSSLVARRAHNPKVVGSNPTRATDRWSTKAGPPNGSGFRVSGAEHHQRQNFASAM